MELKDKVVIGVLALALVLGTVGFFNAGPQGIPGLDGKDAVGAFAGPEISSPFLIVNGVETHYRYSALSSGTDTPCNLRAPIQATSTLAFASARIDTESDSAVQAGKLELYSSLTSGATTTLLAAIETVAASGVELIATTTVTTGAEINMIFSPGEYLVLDYSSATSSLGTGNRGACVAEFIVI